MNLPFRQPGGVISEDPCWVWIVGPYLYTAGTFWGLVWTVLCEWEDDNHLVG